MLIWKRLEAKTKTGHPARLAAFSFRRSCGQHFFHVSEQKMCRNFFLVYETIIYRGLVHELAEES